MVLPVVTEGAAPDVVRRLAVDQSNLLRRDGEYWTVAYDGQVATVRDTKGLRDLARLLAVPEQELHVLDLAAEANTSDAVAGRSHLEHGLSHRCTGLRTDHRRRRPRETTADDSRSWKSEIDDAATSADDERGARAQVERDALVDELTRAYGLGGTVRRTPDHIERARKTVTRRIRDTIGRIERSHSAPRSAPPRLGPYRRVLRL